MNKQPVFIDLQGFKHNNNCFVLKEICIIENNKISHFLVKSPYSWQDLELKYKHQAVWLKNNHHGLDWNDGNTSYFFIKKLLFKLFQNNNNVIVVKGKEKIIWLRQMCNLETKIVDLEDLNSSLIPKLNTVEMSHSCEFHNKNYHCAYKNAIAIKNWYHQNNSEIS